MSIAPESLILTFAPGGSLTRWESMGRLEREGLLLGALGARVGQIILIAQHGERDVAIARDLSGRLGVDIRAISLGHADPDLGAGRPPHERVLAVLDGRTRVVCQTMQLDDAGATRRLLGPLRWAGVQAALVARGGFIGSRVRAGTHGPSSYQAIVAAADEHDLCQNAQIVAGVSETMIDEICWRHTISEDRARVIPHFVETPESDGDPPRRENDLVLATGNLSPSRGLDIVVHAVAKSASRGRVRLEIIGEGPERAALTTLAADLGVTLSLPGRVSHHDLRERMHACAVFVHASSMRRQSRSTLDAMATGAPVVVTDTPEFNGVIDNGGSGIRVAPDADAFAFAIDNLLSDGDWREMLGSAAARKVATVCGLDRVVDRTLEAYSAALLAAPAAGDTPVPASRERRAG